MKHGIITKVSKSSGYPVHPFRVGDKVRIHSIDIVPIGSKGVYHDMKSYNVSLPGIEDNILTVTEYDLREI